MVAASILRPRAHDALIAQRHHCGSGERPARCFFASGPYPRKIERPPREQVMRLILRILINAVALWAAVHFVSGIHFTGSTTSLFGVALVFGILNAIVR